MKDNLFVLVKCKKVLEKVPCFPFLFFYKKYLCWWLFLSPGEVLCCYLEVWALSHSNTWNGVSYSLSPVLFIEWKLQIGHRLNWTWLWLEVLTS